MSFSNELIVIWEDGLMENQIPMYRTQSVGPTWVSCRCVKITLVPSCANIVMNTVVRRSNMEPTCSHWANFGVKRTLSTDIMSDELPTLGQRCVAISGYHFDTHALDVSCTCRVRVVIRSLTKQKT